MKDLTIFVNTITVKWSTIMLMVMLALLTNPAAAATNQTSPPAKYQLKVAYSIGSILQGPLSFGLDTLPATVTAIFTLGEGTVVPGDPDGGPDGIRFTRADVHSASLSFGDAIWPTENLDEDFTVFYSERVIDLEYRAISGISGSVTLPGPVILNFPLTITGTDKATKQEFEYKYAESNPILTEIVLTAIIDVKPGSASNCLNINGHGNIPVAILGSETFDVSTIDLDSLLFGGLQVQVRGNKGPLCSVEFSNDDDYPDLVCHFEDDPSNWVSGSGTVTLYGTLVDGAPFEGSDMICIVP